MTDERKLLRARWFDETRRIHNVDQALRTPAARFLAAEGMRAFAAATRKQRPATRGSDEPLELWLEMRARFRGVG